MSVYNAAHTIEKTLEALKWVDEIIAMDSASTDATQGICRKYPNCKLVYDSCNDINLKRNKGYELAFGDWILNLDADEIVTPALAEEIKNILSLDKDKYDGYFAPNREFLFGKWIYYIHGQKQRPQRYFLFKKGYFRYECKRVHEILRIKGRRGYLKNWFDHRPCNYTVATFITKMNSYSDKDSARVTLDEARERFRWSRMLFLPLKQFLIMYVKHQGFRDGAQGFLLSALTSFNVFIEYAKLWERLYLKNAGLKEDQK